jgi:hypothetical protein
MAFTAVPAKAGGADGDQGSFHGHVGFEALPDDLCSRGHPEAEMADNEQYDGCANGASQMTRPEGF